MRRFSLLLIALLALSVDALACTSAIGAASRSSDGVPMLWKHRDNTFDNTHVEYVDDGTYAYTAITANRKGGSHHVFAGINEVGLGFISTATNNMPAATFEEYKACRRRRLRGATMWQGLANCATVDEFEELLRTTKRSRGMKSNIGVGDATGAVAYFEIWDLGYRRYDVSGRGEAGFDVRANFSHARIKGGEGATARRYNLIMKEMEAHKRSFTPWDFIGYSRSYNSLKYGDVLKSKERYFCRSHTVARNTSVGSFVIVCDGKNPRMLVMNGSPISSMAVPVYVNAKREIPQCVSGTAMRDLSREFKAEAYHTITNTLHILNKELVGKVLKIKHPKIEMPRQLPPDIRAFNNRIDEQFAKHEAKVRKVLNATVIAYPIIR